eukprot:3284073-Prymnesium_polylepis.1
MEGVAVGRRACIVSIVCGLVELWVRARPVCWPRTGPRPGPGAWGDFAQEHLTSLGVSVSVTASPVRDVLRAQREFISLPGARARQSGR